MPSYNLPIYPAPLAVPPSLRSQKSAVASLTTISPIEQATDPNTLTPDSSPLPIPKQASFTLRVERKPVYTPSSLSPLWRPRISESKETTSNPSPTLSLRYLSPPNFYSPCAIQQIRLPPFPFIPRTRLQVDKFYEETIASTLGRRLREKCLRGQIGEKAGMGVRAGREMRLLAALGNCRERKERSERGSGTRIYRATNVEGSQAYKHSRPISSKIFSQRTKDPPAQASSSTSPTSLAAKPKTSKSTGTSVRSLLKRASTSFMRTSKLEQVLPTAQVKQIEGGAVIIHLGSDEPGGIYDDLEISKVAELGKDKKLLRDPENQRAKDRNRGEGDPELKGKEWDDSLPLSPIIDFPTRPKDYSSSSSTSTLFIEPSPPPPKKFNSDLSGSSSNSSNHVPTELPRRPPRAIFALPSRKSRDQIRSLHPMYSPAYELEDASPSQDSSSKKIPFPYFDPAGAISVHLQNLEGNDSTLDQTISPKETKLLRIRAPFALQLPEVAASLSLHSNRTMRKEKRGLVLGSCTSRCGGQDRIGFL